jgi:hypothetical protein
MSVPVIQACSTNATSNPRCLFLLGRHWSIVALVAVLALELAAGLFRVRWVVTGAYSWLPMIPPVMATVAFGLYLLLIGVAAFGLWRRLRLGYPLALVLAAVQLARPIAIVISELHTATWGHLASLLLWGWVFPAYILISLAIAGGMQDHIKS